MHGKWLISAMQEHLRHETAIRYFFNTPFMVGKIEQKLQ